MLVRRWERTTGKLSGSAADLRGLLLTMQNVQPHTHDLGQVSPHGTMLHMSKRVHVSVCMCEIWLIAHLYSLDVSNVLQMGLPAISPHIAKHQDKLGNFQNQCSRITSKYLPKHEGEISPRNNITCSAANLEINLSIE